MANELRIRQIGIGGLIENNPLASGGTTLFSSALAAITGGVGSTQHLPIVLDPDGIVGAPEIVYVTALTNGAVSATIVRGQEGTTAREHIQGIPWVHGPTLLDVIDVASARVTTTESTTSTSMVDLATAGPSATVVVPASGKVKVTLSAHIVAGSGTSGWMGVALSGANTVAANQNDALASPVAHKIKASSTFVMSGLTPGSTTFTAKYRIDDGVASTSFAYRHIVVETVTGTA